MNAVKVNTKEVPNSHIGDQYEPLYGYELYATCNDTTNTTNTINTINTNIELNLLVES